MEKIHEEIDYFDQDFIHKILPDNVSITEIPTIQYDRRFIGHTDYIDQILPGDMEYCIMKGVDHYRRPFISFTWENNVQTFFQRYSDNSNIWTHGKIGIPFIKNCGNILNQSDSIQQIKSMIQKYQNKKNNTISVIKKYNKKSKIFTV